MKKIITAVLLVVTLAVAGVAGAAPFVKIENGEIMISPANWLHTGVEVTSEARKYPAEVEQAFLSSGKVVSVQEQERAETKIVDMFHYRQDIVSRVGVKYDVNMATIGIVTDNEIVKPEVRFFWFPVLWLVSIGTYFIFIKTKEVLTATVAITTAIVAGGTAFAASASIIAAVCTVVGAAVIAVFVPDIMFSEENGKKRLVISAVFVIMLLSAGLVYWPLFF